MEIGTTDERRERALAGAEAVLGHALSVENRRFMHEVFNLVDFGVPPDLVEVAMLEVFKSVIAGGDPGIARRQCLAELRERLPVQEVCL